MNMITKFLTKRKTATRTQDEVETRVACELVTQFADGNTHLQLGQYITQEEVEAERATLLKHEFRTR